MKILINGICKSRGPGSWPYFLQEMLNCDLVNLSLSGVGGSYLLETTITELTKRAYHLVIIMWNTPHYTSFKVDDITKYADSKNTSLYQSSVNDWPEKIIEPINDQDYVEKNWIMGTGHKQEPLDSVAKFFSVYHSAVKYKQTVENDLIRIISLQSYLKYHKQPYLFTYGETIRQWKQYAHLYNQIDWSNWYLDDTINNIANRDNGRLKSEDSALGDTPEGHKIYAELLATHITKQLLNDTK